MTPLLFLFAFSVYLKGLAPGVAGDDAGELVMAVLRLDVTHPPGYPLLCLAGRLAACLPAGSPAFRVTLLVAACAATAVTLAGLATRALLRRAGHGGGVARWLAMALAGGLPALFHQATLTEKYAPHLALALLVIHAFARADGRVYALVFLAGVALAHHPQALFLLPLLWPARRLLRRPPELALACALALLPLSAKALYPAIRAHAAVTDTTLAAWGQPDTAGALGRYLTVRQYGRRFGTTPAAFAGRLGDQLAGWRNELPAGALPAAAWGAWRLSLAAPGVAVPLLLVLPGHAWLAGGFELPVHLASAYHVVPLTLVAMAAAAAPALTPCLLGPPLAVWLALHAWRHDRTTLPPLSKARDTMVWDANRALLALCPPRALLVAGMDNDLFALRYLTGPLAERADVTVADAPGQTKVASWRAAFARAAPDAPLPPGPDGAPADAWRALGAARTPRCIVLSGYLEPALPLALDFTGPLATLPVRPCGDPPAPARRAAAWARLPSRSLRLAAATTPRGEAITGVYAATLVAQAGRALAAGRIAEAAALAAVGRARYAGDPGVWSLIGALALGRGETRAAVAAYQRAAALTPREPDGWGQAALVLAALGADEALADLALQAADALPGADAGALRTAAGELRGSRASRAGRARALAALAGATRAAAAREAAAGPLHARRAAALAGLADRLAR